MTIRVSAALVAAFAVAVTVAPVAAASPDGTQCGERGKASICQRPGHSAVHAEPPQLERGAAGRLFSPSWMPGFGRGSMPAMPGVDRSRLGA